MDIISLKLLLGKEKNRVVFAESDKDFIDILFSFLTLPMGTIARLLDSSRLLDAWINCIRVNHDTEHFWLWPAKQCYFSQEVKQKYYEFTYQYQWFRASKNLSVPKIWLLRQDAQDYSSVPGARCFCWKAIDRVLCRKVIDPNEEDGVFWKEQQSSLSVMTCV